MAKDAEAHRGVAICGVCAWPQWQDSNAGRHPLKDTPKFSPRQVVLLRHGESVWNKENLFTGWTDVDLCAHGREELREAGRQCGEALVKYLDDVSDADIMELGIDVDEVTQQFEDEGVEKFYEPFDKLMAVLNDLDRSHLVGDVIDRVPRLGPVAAYTKQYMRKKLIKHSHYIGQPGQDMPEILDWKWPNP